MYIEIYAKDAFQEDGPGKRSWVEPSLPNLKFSVGIDPEATSHETQLMVQGTDSGEYPGGKWIDYELSVLMGKLELKEIISAALRDKTISLEEIALLYAANQPKP